MIRRETRPWADAKRYSSRADLTPCITFSRTRVGGGRILRPIVPSLRLPVFDVPAEFRVRRRIAAPFVRDDHARAGVTLEPAAHEPLGGGRVTTALHPHVKHGALRVNGPPPPMLVAVDRHDRRVNVPRVCAYRRRRTKARGDRQAERRCPAPHRFVREFDSAHGQGLFKHAPARRAPVTAPQRRR